MPDEPTSRIEAACTTATAFDTGTRLGLIEELKAMMTYLSPEETDLHDLTLSTLRKLERLTDTAFAALDLEIDGL